MYEINLPDLLGLSYDYLIMILAALIVVLIIIMIVNTAKTSRMKKSYRAFMEGKDMKSMEEILMKKFEQVDKAVAVTDKNTEEVQNILETLNKTFMKVGMVKYDAFNEMGGKLSFSLALLNKANDGFIINAMHSREGCYTYIKEIVNGNSYLVLSDEEAQALSIAKGEAKPQPPEES
ncbi:DUF4446 family protein [Eubacterium oxidoreducens]|uniref:DUF4446 family protein n=1 Tax=Eubacterium oxidoreducens TaxID=1732 RepID=A0A1G6CPY8_EUBOX|nr:DUF4446 family protein [Eubacterium oxidoreducens]SDB34953.1 Protein of unknown function [Eubacterium oxidoreducens]